MLPNFDIEFTVEHDAFYRELKKWRKDVIDKQEINNCVYILMASKPVPRVLKDDEDSILYIGKGLLTRNHERIGELINSVNNGTSKQHDAGVNYQRIIEKFPIIGLRLGVLLTDDDKSRIEEMAYLNEYIEEFGELPPLNMQG